MTKELFVEVINQIKEIHKFEDNLSEAFGSIVIIPTGESLLIKLLEEDAKCSKYSSGSDIEYFIYELEFGTKYEPGMVLDGNEEVDLSTAEKLYDYLYKGQV